MYFFFLYLLLLCFWKRSILEIKILSTSDFNNVTEWGWVPVCTCEPTLGHDQRVARLFPFLHTSPWKEETNTFHEVNSNCRINPQNYRVPVKNESEKKDCFQDFFLKTNVPIIEIVMAERGPYPSSRWEKNIISFWKKKERKKSLLCLTWSFMTSTWHTILILRAWNVGNSSNTINLTFL